MIEQKLMSATLLASAAAMAEGDGPSAGDFRLLLGHITALTGERLGLVLDLDQKCRQIDSMIESMGTDRDAFSLQSRLRAAKSRVLGLEEQLDVWRTKAQTIEASTVERIVAWLRSFDDSEAERAAQKIENVSKTGEWKKVTQ